MRPKSPPRLCASAVSSPQTQRIRKSPRVNGPACSAWPDTHAYPVSARRARLQPAPPAPAGACANLIRRRPPVRGATPTRPPVRGATPARTPRLSYRHPRVPGRPRGGVVEQRERRTADCAALPAVHRSDVHPPPPPPRPRPPRPSAKRAPGRRSARSEQPPPAPAGACPPSGAADRSTRRRRAVRTPIAARAAARPAARKQARCRKRVDGMPPNGTVRAACEAGLPSSRSSTCPPPLFPPTPTPPHSKPQSS